MEGLPNRKQRRLWAKEAGLFKKKAQASQSERAAMTTRSMEIGKEIHLANVERMLRAEDAKKEKAQLEKIQKLIDQGVSPEDALIQINGPE